MRGRRAGQALPDLRGQLHLILTGDRQQCLPIVLQHLRRLIAGELHHARQHATALARAIAAPRVGRDRGHRVIRQQIQCHVEEGRARRRPRQRLQHQLSQLTRLFSGQRQQYALAVVARARGVMQVEDGADRVTHSEAPCR